MLKIAPGLVIMETLSSEAVRSQLEKIIASEGFARNDRISSFLRFVVEQELSGSGNQLKESIIGFEVFGRRPDYDVRQDSIVRTEAAKLRTRLSKYYANGGAADELIIDLPKGGYRPVFRNAEVTREEAAVSRAPKRQWSRLQIPSAGIRAWVVIAVGLAIGLATLAWWRLLHKSEPIPIAVLPLINLNQDPANDYFADGLTDELIRNLSIIDGLTVRSRTSSFALKGKAANISDAGQQLHADYILEGSVLRAGQQLRIDVQLVRVRDDFSVWSGRFDRDLTDVFAIQDEISLGIVNNLRLKLGQGRRRYETSVEAYDLYLHARAQPDQRGHDPAVQAAVIYRQVIARDPLFAPAYAGLASASAASSAQGFSDDHDGELTEMRAAAETAIRLDPLLAEAHDALGMMYARDGKWEQSERSFRRAIELDPNDSSTHADFSIWVLWPLGRIEEAVHQMRLAEKADPLSSFIRQRLGIVLIVAGKYDEAASHCAGSPECLGRARLGQGRIDEAIQILSTSANRYKEISRGRLGYAYGRAGRRADAEKIAASVAPNAYSQAIVYAGLGDKDRTFEALDRVAGLAAVRIGRALKEPEFALLRGDPRAKALQKRVGLPDLP